MSPQFLFIYLISNLTTFPPSIPLPNYPRTPYPLDFPYQLISCIFLGGMGGGIIILYYIIIIIHSIALEQYYNNYIILYYNNYTQYSIRTTCELYLVAHIAVRFAYSYKNLLYKVKHSKYSFLFIIMLGHVLYLNPLTLII